MSKRRRKDTDRDIDRRWDTLCALYTYLPVFIVRGRERTSVLSYKAPNSWAFNYSLVALRVHRRDHPGPVPSWNESRAAWLEENP